MTGKEMTAYAAGTRCRHRPIIPQMTKAAAEELGLAPGCEVIFHYDSDWTGERKLAEKYGKGGRNRNSTLRTHFRIHGRAAVEGMLCLQHAAKERRKLDRG